MDGHCCEGPTGRRGGFGTRPAIESMLSPPWKDLCSACLNEQCVWNRFLSEFSSCGMNLLVVSWSINLEHLVRVASCNTFDYSGGVGRAAAGQPGAEELRGQDQGEPGDNHRLPHPRRHAWLLWQSPLWLRPTYFCRWLAAFPGVVFWKMKEEENLFLLN
ncbi:uncharacterized protein [Triticum aestivum]|uniref:uncharacterized protein isoform X3 n=1 Tax=Triticum aestivum TaxID=4565 RepID=UPI001D00322C|nr:uncharacterized protein LOC123159076 isoform X3 [Triticum aestivum]